MSDLPSLARLSAAIVLGDWDELRSLRRAHEPDRGWRETVLQSYLFAGFPRVVEALSTLQAEGGLGPIEAGEEDLDDAELGETARKRGHELFERIYGDHTPAVLSSLEASHPVFARWIEGHAYGRVLTRTGLSAAERECLAVASLAALGQKRQLAAHLRGGMRCGASARDLHAVLHAVEDLIGPERSALAMAVAAKYAPL